MSIFSVARALFGYFFLVLIVRVVGRRPGRQLTPFELLLVFFLGGLMLTAIVADERSGINAFCQIMAIAVAHFAIACWRARSDRMAKLLDGVPLLLFHHDGMWQSATMKAMHVTRADVAQRAREQGLRRLAKAERAVLERNGDISILPREEDEPPEDSKEPAMSERESQPDVDIGEDLAFQRRWWRFETGVWIVFAIVIVADLAGVLGRGPLAHTERRATDGSLRVRYDRVQRMGTPTMVTIAPGAAAIHDGTLRLFVDTGLLEGLGVQRVIPEPLRSTLGEGGVTYTFTTTRLPMTVQLELSPQTIGSHTFVVGVPDGARVEGRSFVLP